MRGQLQLPTPHSPTYERIQTLHDIRPISCSLGAQSPRPPQPTSTRTYRELQLILPQRIHFGAMVKVSRPTSGQLVVAEGQWEGKARAFELLSLLSLFFSLFFFPFS